MSILKSASVSSFLSLFLVNSAFAVVPPKCPGASDIQAQEENNTVTCVADECTYSMENHRFDTDLYWHFFMKFKAASIDEAKTKASDALKSLAIQSGPTEEHSDLYFCRYTNSYGFEAIAAYSEDNKLSKLISN
ncbi:MAG: hypothetical protein V4501_07210 [Pseudomonadota bacterium]